MLMSGLLLGLVLAMRLFPETPFARLLHLYLVEKPMLWAATVQRAHLIYVCLVVVLLLGAGETMVLFGAPHLFLAFAWDLSLYLDALAVTYLLAAASQMKTLFHALRSKLSFSRSRSARSARRAGRTRAARTRPARKDGDNDDEPAPSPALAA